MREIIIGDIHGRRIWKEILANEQNFDRVIFIGDYVDTHYDISGIEQLNNLEDIIALKKDNHDKVILLVGNHDFQYWPGVTGEWYSGRQEGMAVSFQYVFNENRSLFQMAFEDEQGVLYTHAGVTATYLNDLRELVGDMTPAQILNIAFESNPMLFCFFSGDRSGCGDNIRQSCIWVRPSSLKQDKIEGLQVVGHTTVQKIIHPNKGEPVNFYMIDALENGWYLVCDNGEFEIKQV